MITLINSGCFVSSSLVLIFTIEKERMLIYSFVFVQVLFALIQNYQSKIGNIHIKFDGMHTCTSVSYTHLDVYKRQV